MMRRGMVGIQHFSVIPPNQKVNHLIFFYALKMFEAKTKLAKSSTKRLDNKIWNALFMSEI